MNGFVVETTEDAHAFGLHIPVFGHADLDATEDRADIQHRFIGVIAARPRSSRTPPKIATTSPPRKSGLSMTRREPEKIATMLTVGSLFAGVPSVEAAVPSK